MFFMFMLVRYKICCILLFWKLELKYDVQFFRTHSKLVDSGSFSWHKYIATCQDYMYTD
jgi:hypothetical protein